MERNIPYLYLQELASFRKKPGKFIEWMVFYFILSPNVLSHFFMFCADLDRTTKEIDEYKAKKGFRHSLMIFIKWTLATLQVVLYILIIIIISYLRQPSFVATLAKFLPSVPINAKLLTIISILLWIVFSLLVNLLVLFLINLFAFPANFALVKLIRNNDETKHFLFDEIWGSLWGSFLNQGDKLWARKRTFKLLNDLAESQSGKRAKWFIVNFLAHLADDRIGVKSAGTGELYVVDTGENDWSACRYSTFLAENMEHAEDKILWLVDPNDFFGVLLPGFLTYLLASYAIETCGVPGISFEEEMPAAVESVFNKYTDPPKGSGISSDDWKGYYNEIIPSEIRKTTINLNPSDLTGNERDDHIWVTFHEKVLEPMSRYGAHIIHANNTSSIDIEKGFSKLTRVYLNYIFPHITAFGNAHRVNIKRRVLFMGFSMPKTGQDSWLIEQIGKYWKKNEMKWPKYLLELATPEMIEKSLELFASTCGQSDVIVVQGHQDVAPQNADIEAKILFSMESEFQEDLIKAGEVSERLWKKFTDNGIKLPQKATIRAKEEHDTWVVNDEDGSILYVIKKEDDSLNTYAVKTSLDVGLYDDQFLVRATPSASKPENPPRRRVEWFYGSETTNITDGRAGWRKELDESLGFALKILERTGDDQVISFKSFKDSLLQYLRNK